MFRWFNSAKILGVDTEKVYAATFGINAALCGVAGALISITFTIHPYMGLPYTISLIARPSLDFFI